MLAAASGASTFDEGTHPGSIRSDELLSEDLCVPIGWTVSVLARDMRLWDFCTEKVIDFEAFAMEFRTLEVARATPSIMRPTPYRLAKKTVAVRHKEKAINMAACAVDLPWFWGVPAQCIV